MWSNLPIGRYLLKHLGRNGIFTYSSTHLGLYVSAEVVKQGFKSTLLSR